MNSFKITPVAKQIGLPAGRYVGEIVSASLKESGGLDPKTGERIYNSSTQVVVTWDTDAGKQTHHFNTIGYLRYDELSEKDKQAKGKNREFKYVSLGDAGYAVDEDGQRIPNAARTEKSLKILGEFVDKVGKENNLPTDENGDYDISQLVNCKIGIVVGPRADNREVNEYKFAVSISQAKVEDTVEVF